jgi:serine/threonine protein kinase
MSDPYNNSGDTPKDESVQAGDAAPGRASRKKYLVKLRQILTTRFDEGELRTLCFDLGIDYDDLPAEGRANTARELVYYLERHDRISELVTFGERLRPDISWTDAPEDTGEASSESLLPEADRVSEAKPGECSVRSEAGEICLPLSGKYTVEHELGRGGGGCVYLATDELGRQVALKHRKALTADDQYHGERLLQEARTVANLRHRNVALVYTTESYPESGDYCVVMEYADGGTLADLLGAEGRLSLEKALDIGIEVCTALEYVHRRDLVHGDIKPSNILFFHTDDRIDTKIADFGLSQSVRGGGHPREGRVGAFSGTWEYAAPELFQDDQTIDRRADLYSLGVVLYEMLAGEPPFPFSGDLAAVIAGHLHGELTPLQELRPAVFDELNRLVLKALAKSLLERFQDAETMLAALQEARELCIRRHEQAEKLYSKAIRLEKRKRWPDAVQSFEQAHNLNPELKDVEQRLQNAQLQLELENTWREMERLLAQEAWADALEQLGRIAKLAPEYRAEGVAKKTAHARLQLDLASRYGDARAAEGAGRRREAIRLYVGIVSKDDSYRDATQRLAHLRTEEDLEKLWSKGERLVQNEKWEEAIKAYQQMLDKDPGHAGAGQQLAFAQRKLEIARLYAQALAEMEKENWDNAISALQDVTRREPGYKDAAVRLARLSRRQQLIQRRQSVKRAMDTHQWSEAEKLLEELLRWEPGDEEAQQQREQVQQWQRFEGLYRQGMGGYEAHRWDEAISKLEEASIVADGAGLDLHDYIDVGSLVEQAKTNRHLDGLREQAKQHESSEDFGALIQVLDQILELDPANQELQEWKKFARQQMYLSDLYADALSTIEQGDWDGARRLLDEIAKIDAEYKDVQEKRIQAAMNLGINVSGQAIDVDSAERVPTVPPPPREFNWMANSIVAFITGGLCTFLITQLAREILASLDPTRRMFSIVFLLFILVPLSFVMQWRVAQRAKAKGVKVKDGSSTD